MVKHAPAGPGRRQVLVGGAAAVGLLAGGSTLAADGPVAETASGKVRGVANGKVMMFRGVPYGASTAGANRFIPPRKPVAWSGVRDALAYGPRAPQNVQPVLEEERVAGDTSPMSEDCLVLNVWTTGLKDGGKRPVMVWFHGGGFSVGSGGNRRFDGSSLAAKDDVVVVTVNHRLNIFGFLYLAELGDGFADSGNAGMLDCVAALRWVHDTIANFGGDPGRVMIFGESGGGAKVCTLMAMPGAKGLFHRAIVESGMALRSLPREVAARTARTALDQLGVKPDQLQGLPTQRLLDVAKGISGLSPVIDGTNLPANPFDPAAPAVSADVPMIIGTNLTEVTFFPITPLDPIDDGRFHTLVKDLLKVDDTDADRIIGLYRAGRPGQDNTFLYQVLASDNWMGLDSSIGAERKTALGSAPAYLYHFEKLTPIRNGRLHSPHTLEIPYVFDNVEISEAITGPGDDRFPLAERMSRTWAAFARSGSPDIPGAPAWPPYSGERRAVMIFDVESRVAENPHAAERAALLAARGNRPAPVGR